MCIKIVAEATNSRRNQNKREHAYYKKLADKNIDWKHIASCHGWVKTNLGKGLVFDLVADHDNAPLPNLQEQLEEKNIDKEKLKFELKMLKKWIFEHAIIVADLKPENMIYISHKPKGQRLILVDGVNDRNFIKLFNRIPYIARMKMNRIWERFTTQHLSKYGLA